MTQQNIGNFFANKNSGKKYVQETAKPKDSQQDSSEEEKESLKKLTKVVKVKRVEDVNFHDYCRNI